MRLSGICFTKNGHVLARRIEAFHTEFSYVTKCREERSDEHYLKEDTKEWVKRQLQKKNALLFIGAAGIAIRMIAPFVEDKLTDSPVVVADEQGRFVIPLLSGHMGGANELAVSLADKLGALPVITTATDAMQAFSADLYAKEERFEILRRQGITRVSEKVLQGQRIYVSVPKERLDGEIPPDIYIADDDGAKRQREHALLVLSPREYVLGAGCRKGKTAEEIEAFAAECLAKAGLKLHQVAFLASIDAKRDEKGLLEFAEKHRIPFVTFSAEALADVPGVFCDSSFVEQTVGVGNVCERAAIAACPIGGTLVLPKQAKDGLTFAVAKRKWSLEINEA